MANWTFLDAYMGSIPASQKQQLANTLFGQINSGTLSSIGEYENRLATGLQELEDTTAQPTFKYREQPTRSVTNSANYNDMEARAITDLKSLYTEATLLEQVIGDHSQITTAKLSTIAAAVGRMEKQVDILEILAANTDGYISSVFNAFDEENTNRLERFQTTSTTMFTVDPGYLTSQYDAAVDNDALRLPVSKTTVYRLESVRLQNQIPPRTQTQNDTIPSQNAEFGLAKLIDSNPDTYWAEVIDTTDLTPRVATVDVVVNLLGVQQLSRITIEPFSRYPYQITAIMYRKRKDVGTAENIIGIQNLPITVQGKTLIEFPTIYAEQLVISIKQSNFSQLRYCTNGSNSTITNLFDLASGKQLVLPEDLQPSNATNTLYYAMTSNMKTLLGIDRSLLSDSNTVDVFEFMYGIKTLEVSQQFFRESGIFVSKNYTVEKLGAIGLETDETIMPRESTALTSIEYDLFVEAHSGDEITRYTSPILPSDTDTIEGEILDGTIDTNWSAKTRFPVGADLAIYKNGETLGAGAYSLSVDPSDGCTIVTVYANVIGLPSIRTSVFTASYIPTSAAYTFELGDPDVEYAIINLRIFLRSIDPNRQLTPSIRSYSLKFKKYTNG